MSPYPTVVNVTIKNHIASKIGLCTPEESYSHARTAQLQISHVMTRNIDRERVGHFVKFDLQRNRKSIDT